MDQLAIANTTEDYYTRGIASTDQQISYSKYNRRLLHSRNNRIEVSFGSRNGSREAPHGRYINKRALKNKAVAVTFNEKGLDDFVSGFHKRKKKRRKEAEKQLGEALRRKLLELRKKRRLEKEFVLFGGAPPVAEGEGDENENDEGEASQEEDEGSEPDAPISGTTTYDNGDIKVTVTTSEISKEEEIHPVKKTEAVVPETVGAAKKNNVPVSKKKPFKKVVKRKSGPKMQKKRDKRKGKEKASKRR